MTRDEKVRWLRSEAATIDTIRTRVARAAEEDNLVGPGSPEMQMHARSRRQRGRLYDLADALTAAYEGVLAALDEVDPTWDDPEERGQVHAGFPTPARVGDPFARTFDAEDPDDDTRTFLVTISGVDNPPDPETIGDTIRALYEETYRGATTPR